jgi:hypothetical protein
MGMDIASNKKKADLSQIDSGRYSCEDNHFAFARKAGSLLDGKHLVYGLIDTKNAMVHRTLITLGAVAVAGLAVFGFGRQLDRWRRSNLSFEFPIEELFI